MKEELGRELLTIWRECPLLVAWFCLICELATFFSIVIFGLTPLIVLQFPFIMGGFRSMMNYADLLDRRRNANKESV